MSGLGRNGTGYVSTSQVVLIPMFGTASSTRQNGPSRLNGKLPSKATAFTAIHAVHHRGLQTSSHEICCGRVYVFLSMGAFVGETSFGELIMQNIVERKHLRKKSIPYRYK